MAVLVLVPALLLAFINTPPGRSLFSSIATKWSGRGIELSGHFYPLLSWPPSMHVSRLTIANKEGGRQPYMAEIGTMDIALGPKALAKGKFRIRKLALTDSNIHLERDAQGIANWSLSSASSSDEITEIPSLGDLYLENSTLTYFDVPQQTDIQLKAATEGETFVLKGEGKYRGRLFGLISEVAATCLAHHARSCPIETTLTVGHTSLHAKGKVSELMPPRGADFMVDIKGADAAELFPLFGIALPPTAPYHLTGHLTYENARWHFNDFSGKMGESDLKGNALWDKSAAQPKLTATLVSERLRFVDLGPLIGMAPETRLSSEQKELGARQEASITIIPDVPLDISRLSSMDAEVEFTGKQVISENLPLDDFYMKLSLDDRLMKLTPVRFGTASGNISTDMVIDARQTPVKDHADIRLSNLKLAGLLRGVGKSLGDVEPPTGEIGGTITLSGSGKSLHEMLGSARGVSGLGMEGGSISNLLIKLLSLDIARSLGFLLTGDKPLPIRCVVASFDIEQGIMNTDSFVIDTVDTSITAEGTVDLKSEKLGLRILPAPKKATALSLRSPINITGTLKDPHVSIEKGPLAARGAIATGLAALAPAAAIVAFLEPGMGKDMDCTALLSQMNAKTGKTPKTNEIPRNP